MDNSEPHRADNRSAEAELNAILKSIPDPRGGLPDEVFHFIRQVTPLLNVDLLVQCEKGTLLAWREDEYHVGWHIPGGIVRFREPLRARIDAVADIELGVAVESDPEPCAMNELRDHPRGHFLSLLYRCRVHAELPVSRLYSGSRRPAKGALSWIRGVPADLYPAQQFYAGWLAAIP